MRFIEDYAKKKTDIKQLGLQCLCENPALHFYEKLGYKKVSYNMRKKIN